VVYERLGVRGSSERMIGRQEVVLR